jgi:hypothetical protein
MSRTEWPVFAELGRGCGCVSFQIRPHWATAKRGRVQLVANENKKINIYVGLEVLTAVVMKVVIFWDITPCSPCMIQRFERTYQLYFQGRKSDGHLLACWFLVRQIFDLKMKLIRSYKTVIYFRTTRLYIPEDSNFLYVPRSIRKIIRYFDKYCNILWSVFLSIFKKQ